MASRSKGATAARRMSVRRVSGLAFLALLGLHACAHIRPLEGGPADETPPMLLAAQPADSSVGLGPTPVLHLRFSETLMSGGVSSAVRTYPSTPRPEVRAKGAEVELRWREPLPPDTTVAVVFGEPIQDVRGRDNPLPREIWFVFATGDSLHGGAVRGRVLVKGKPEPQAAVRCDLIAATLATEGAAPGADTTGTAVDSTGKTRGAQSSAAPPKPHPAAKRRMRPSVAATDAEGLFTMLGLPAGRPFQLTAFVDRNGNLDLDEGELAAAYPETLLLHDGEVRRGLEWNLVDPHEPGQVRGVVFNRTSVQGRVAIALEPLDVDSLGAGADSSTASADTSAVRADSLAGAASPGGATAATTPDSTAARLGALPLSPQGVWAQAYTAFGNLRGRGRLQVVYASPRGDYSIRVAPGRHRWAAFVDASGDSLPGPYVVADSTERDWEPLWVGGVLEVAPAAEVRPRAIDIEAPR